MLKAELIAPCGMNCAVCVGFFGYTMGGNKRKTQCRGCRSQNKACAFLKKHCDQLLDKQVDYCSDCTQYPCNWLKKLDTRYRTKYGISLIENLNVISQQGIHAFLAMQAEQFACPECGETLCVHTKHCYSCSFQMQDHPPN